ncbi:MAG: response regulator [Sphingosinicella sp.]
MLLGRDKRTIRRILVVEDEPLVAFDNEHLLKDAGYEVVATVDIFEAAREVIENEQLDLVLTDLRLAGEDDPEQSGEGGGYGVARAARQRNVPVLFVTAHAVENDEHALGVLAKPYSNGDLRAALAAVDRLRQGRRPRRLPPQLRLFEPV